MYYTQEQKELTLGLAGHVHLHAHELGHRAVRRLDGRRGQQVPERRAVLAVVQQAHGHGLAAADALADFGHLLGVGALPLQEAAAGQGRVCDDCVFSVCIYMNSRCVCVRAHASNWPLCAK